VLPRERCTNMSIRLSNRTEHAETTWICCYTFMHCKRKVTEVVRWIKYLAANIGEMAKFSDNSKTKILHCSVLGYDTVYSGRWLLTFRSNILPPSSENKWYLPIRLQHGHIWTYKDLIVLFPTANLIKNIRKYEIYSALLPICTVAMAATAM
jgi:hypothetical protein